MKSTKITFTAAGDALIQRMIPTDTEAFQTLRNYIRKGQACF